MFLSSRTHSPGLGAKCLLLAIAGVLSGATASAETSGDAANFPFQSEAFRARFQQSFFSTTSNLFEQILHATGVLDKTNTIHIKDKSGNDNFVSLKSLKTSLHMDANRLTAAVSININNAQLFAADNPGCSVLLQGPLSFSTVMTLTPGGPIGVDIPANLFAADQLQIQKQNCGFLANVFAGPEMIRGMLKDGLQADLGSVLNSQELDLVEDAQIDRDLKQARVFMNLPPSANLNPNMTSNFGVSIGVRGTLSSAKNPDEGLKIVPAQSAYVTGLGLEWALDSGVKAISQNIFDTSYVTRMPRSTTSWPNWGESAYQKTGSRVGFDAAVMLKAGVLRSLFAELYKAGFFNLQIQDSLLNKTYFTMNPDTWSELFQITLPNGQPLKRANYKDLKMETVMTKPPVIDIRDAKSLDLQIPDITVKLSAQAKNSAMFEVLKFRARFHIIATPVMNENGQLQLQFNDSPIESFQLISRSGVGTSISENDIQARMNQTIVEVLSRTKTEIPILKNYKVTIPYMGIDGDRASGSEALAVYLKIK